MATTPNAAQQRQIFGTASTVNKLANWQAGVAKTKADIAANTATAASDKKDIAALTKTATTEAAGAVTSGAQAIASGIKAQTIAQADLAATTGNVYVPPKGPSEITKDAFAALDDLFAQYNLSSLSGVFKQLMGEGYTATEALVKVKTDSSLNPTTGKAWNAAYTLRFAGNAALVKNGKNAMSEAAYINLEDSMANTLQAYGHGAMLNKNRTDNEATMSQWIGNGWNATDFNDLINTAVTRVENADPQILKQMQVYYPELQKTDLISYMLNPKETLVGLKQKVATGEIGAAFQQQGLASGLTSMSDLAAYGVTQDQAIAGASNIAAVLPDTSKLSNIYKETGIEYNQETGTQEFLKSNAKAAQKRKLLASAERGSFEGSAGVAGAGYNTNYLKTSLVKGQI